jgi:hypothetical protein
MLSKLDVLNFGEEEIQPHPRDPGKRRNFLVFLRNFRFAHFDAHLSQLG